MAEGLQAKRNSWATRLLGMDAIILFEDTVYIINR